MAATFTKQTLIDGSKNLVVKIHIAGDAGGDVTDTVLIDASTYTPPFTDAKLVAIHASLAGFTANLEWDATVDAPLINIPDYEFNWSGTEVARHDGISNDAGAGVTGDILITTNGLGAGDHGTIVISLVKKGL